MVKGLDEAGIAYFAPQARIYMAEVETQSKFALRHQRQRSPCFVPQVSPDRSLACYSHIKVGGSTLLASVLVVQTTTPLSLHMSTISDVKERIDIVALVSEYTPLTKAGKNYKGLCPFHAEKHASFFVFPDRQTWRCFGACGEGGDAFSFMMKKEGVDFREALEMLAQRAGVQIERKSAPDIERDEAKERLLAAIEATTEYYHNLLVNSEAGARAREYLSHRNIAGETISGFRLGYSPDGWTALKDLLSSRGYSETELVEAGLLVQREDGSSYDRFRDRVMFPICDAQGKVVGFGARAFDDLQPKYVNSPQTRIFDKSSVLYGIHRARAAALTTR